MEDHERTRETMRKLLSLFPYEAQRPTQAAALEVIAQMFKENTRFNIIEAPTGTGKSALAIAAARYAALLGDHEFEPGAYILTPYDNLADQLISDFRDLGAAVLRGRKHYEAKCGATFLGAPIASPTRLYGYVGLIDRIGRDEFSKEDERLTAILAAQVGRIYQNGSVYSDVLSHAADLEREISARKQTEEALAERVRQGALIGEVDAALTQSDSQGEMLVRCAKALVRHLDAALD